MKTTLCTILSLLILGPGLVRAESKTAAEPISAEAKRALESEIAQARKGVETYLRAINNVDPLALYDSLPGETRKKLGKLVAASSKKINPKLWALSLKALRVMGTIHETKAEMLYDAIHLGTGIAYVDKMINDFYASQDREDRQMIIDLVKAAGKAQKVYAEKLTLKTMRAGDLRKILSDPEVIKANSLFRKFVPEEVKKATILEGRKEEDGVVFEYVVDGSTNTLTMVKSGGKWVEEDIQEDFEDTLNELLEAIEFITIPPKVTNQAIKRGRNYLVLLNDIKNAKNKEMLNLRLQLLILKTALDFGAEYVAPLMESLK